MKNKKNTLWLLFIAISLMAVVRGAMAEATSEQTTESQSAIAKRIGTIKTLNGNSLTLSPTSGSEVAVSVQPNARILRLAPGDKDLKNATSLQLEDLHVGDTIRVRGTGSPDGNSISALEVIVITQAAVAAVSDQMRQDWQKRGVGGLVESIDTSTGAITLSIPSLTTKKTVVVHTTQDTLVHRYAPDSAKPEDAKPSTLAEIHPGDQLRARGNKNADATEITAEEIYAGVFPQYAATVKSVDASSGILSVQDLASKKTLQVKVGPASQLHKIPAEMAQTFAMRLKGMMRGGPAGSGSGPSARQNAAATGNVQASSSVGATSSQERQERSPDGGTWTRSGGGMRGNGPPDFQRMLSRMPSTTLADMNLQRGDAVIILATEGTATGPHTAITLLSGVEPILQAAPSASQAMMLTPWNLGGGAPGGEGSQ
jgi:hypothetical protein